MADVMGEAVPGLRERKKQRTRATLIDAAIELCERQSFERTTVDQIAAVADVSPRTFSRYFATKEAVALALIDDAVELAAVELSHQPAAVDHLEALCRSYTEMYRNTKTAAPGELTAARLMSTVRIIMSSPTLRQAATEFRPHAVNVELAKRMGVGLGDRGLRLMAAVWASIITTALYDLGRQRTGSTSASMTSSPGSKRRSPSSSASLPTSGGASDGLPAPARARLRQWDYLL